MTLIRGGLASALRADVVQPPNHHGRNLAIFIVVAVVILILVVIVVIALVRLARQRSAAGPPPGLGGAGYPGGPGPYPSGFQPGGPGPSAPGAAPYGTGPTPYPPPGAPPYLPPGAASYSPGAAAYPPPGPPSYPPPGAPAYPPPGAPAYPPPGAAPYPPNLGGDPPGAPASPPLADAVAAAEGDDPESEEPAGPGGSVPPYTRRPYAAGSVPDLPTSQSPPEDEDQERAIQAEPIEDAPAVQDDTAADQDRDELPT